MSDIDRLMKVENSLWFKTLKEQCEKEPDKMHPVFIEQGHKTKEEFDAFLASLDGKLPSNAVLNVIYNKITLSVQ